MTSAFLYKEYYFMLLYKSMLSFVIWKQYLNAHKCKCASHYLSALTYTNLYQINSNNNSI